MSKDLKYYLALIAFLSICLALFLIFNYNRQIQMGISLMMSTGYVVWGVVHHARRKELRPKIILEYVLIAVLASVVVIFLLQRS